MTDAIDPRLYASSVPPRSQSYTSAPQHNPAQQPYYLPSPTQHQSPPLQQPTPLSTAALDPALDPALEQTSPSGPEEEHDEDDQDDEGDADGVHATPGSSKSAGDFKRPRACDSCRGLKVRCDQERPDQSCRRCAKAGRPCITTPPTRKRQKKADSRVAELERKIDALTATLHAQKAAAPEIKHHGGIPQYEGNTPASAMPEGSFRTGTISHDWSTPGAARHPDIPAGYGAAQAMQRGPEAKRRKLGDGHPALPDDMDGVHRDLNDGPELKRARQNRAQSDHSHIDSAIDELMSRDLAERVFLRYVNEMCIHFPAVPLPPGTTAQEMREKKPLLFLSILASSCHGIAEQLVSQDAQRELTKLLKDQLADIIWRNGEKSLEIVQCLQIAVLWYRAPLHFEQHNFYMMVNCAAVMALDLGLGRKGTPNVMKLSTGPFRRFHPNSSGVEARRTFLVCYWLCMSITMMLRRPILLRWTKYMEESVKILETSPDAYPSDKLLCQQVKMARIGENISVQFCMDDPSAEIAISEPKVIYTLKIFENELQQLREENAKMENIDTTLMLAEHVTNLYLHEIALHLTHGPAEFGPPFTSDSLPSPGIKKAIPIGPAHISALGECLTATHGMLDAILKIPLDTLLTLPVIFCVRSVYAIVCLMKMWVTVTSNEEVGAIIKKEDLKIESYTDRLVKMFNAIITRDIQSPHGKFYFVAKRLQERFASIMEGTAKADQPPPENEAGPNARQGQNPMARSSPPNQTPLHLLSEVAMGKSSSAISLPPPHSHPQQQAQAALQAHAQHAQYPAQQQQQQGWYPGMPVHSPEGMGLQQQNFDMNFDFTQFDLGVGSDADLSALFIPDSMAMWNGPMDPIMQTYDAF